MKHVLFITLFLFSQSCGLKITTEVDENLLLGTWELEEIKCYLPVTSNSYVERYEMDSVSDLKVTLQFEGQNVQYTVASDTCTTSATATYATDFNGTGNGKVDLVKVISGSTCDYTMNFTGNGGGGTTGVIKFALLSTYSSDLDWVVSTDKTLLYLDFFTDFKGSSEVNYCDEGCTCVGTYQKKS